MTIFGQKILKLGCGDHDRRKRTSYIVGTSRLDTYRESQTGPFPKVLPIPPPHRLPTVPHYIHLPLLPYYNFKALAISNGNQEGTHYTVSAPSLYNMPQNSTHHIHSIVPQATTSHAPNELPLVSRCHSDKEHN